jgi:hypothetical protein
VIPRRCVSTYPIQPTRCVSGSDFEFVRCMRAPKMGDACPEPAPLVEDVALLDRAPHGRLPRDVTPQWVWVLVRSSGDPAEQVWVRFPVEQAPEGLDVLPAAPPKKGSLGVAVVWSPRAVVAAGTPDGDDLTRPRRRYRARRTRAEPTDRNLVTAQEFAEHVGCSAASVHELVKLGLPSIKAPGLGRRILKEEAVAWLVGGGARKSRVALKLARTAYRAKKAAANGACDGSR